MKKEKRFEKVYTQSGGFSGAAIDIYVDKETGINYVYFQNGNSGGVTPLLDKDGKVVVTKVNDNDSYDDFYE